MASILKVSEATSLAMHALVYLAAAGTRRCTKEIAAALGASEHHLSKVLQRLAKVHLVKAARGPGGGFVLARAPEGISLLEVYQAMEGDVASNDCLFPKRICGGTRCILGSLIRDVNAEVMGYLQATKLADLLDVYFRGEERNDA